MKYSYAEEKLLVALYRLAAGEGDVRSRLVNAYLSFHVLNIDDFPPSLQPEWTKIMQNLTQRGPRLNYRNEVILNPVENTMSKIRNKTASKIADKIVDIFFDLKYNINLLNT